MMLTWSQITDGKKILTCINISPLGLYAEPTIAPDGRGATMRRVACLPVMKVCLSELRFFRYLAVLFGILNVSVYGPEVRD